MHDRMSFAKKIFWTIEDCKWNLSCHYHLWLHGPYGLAKVVEAMPFRFSSKYLQKYGATIGEKCIIDSGFKIHRPSTNIPFKNLFIGNNVYLGHNLLLDLTDKIVLEDNTALGANCQIWTHVGDYNQKLHDKFDYKEKIAPVLIKSGAVCYSGVIINPGAQVGVQARVYAMSMVSGIVPDRQIWGGIPAKYITDRNI